MRRRTRGGPKLLIIVGAVVFLDTTFFTALTPLLPHYARELGLSKTGTGILQAAYPVGTFAAAIPSGMLAARAGVKATVLAGLLGMAVTSVVFSLAGSAWLLDGARFAQGVCSSCAWTGALAWLVAGTPKDRRGRALGSAMGAAIGGALLGPALGATASILGTVATFASVGLLAIALAAAAARMPAAGRGETQPLRELFAALTDRRIVLAIWLVSLPGLLFGVLSVLGPLRLSHLGIGTPAIGAIFLLSAALEAMLSPLVGRVIDRTGALRPVRMGLVAAAGLTALLPWPNASWSLAVVIAASGLAFGSFWVPGFALLTAGSDARGLDYAYGFALMNLAWAPGQGAGAALGGVVADATSDAVPYLTLTGICLLTLLAVRRSSASPIALAEGAG